MGGSSFTSPWPTRGQALVVLILIFTAHACGVSSSSEQYPRVLSGPFDKDAKRSGAASRTLLQSTVDTYNSQVLDANLTSPSPAGTPTTFYVQLSDPDGNPVSDFYDSDLTVTCVTDPVAPPGQTWCDGAPIIRPLGNGYYEITFVTGTIWGSHPEWPPKLAQQTRPIPETYFQGANTLEVLYAGEHLGMSPYTPALQPGALSAQHTVITMYNPSLASASPSRRTYFAQGYQIADKYTNWIRDPSMESTIQAWITPMTGGGVLDMSQARIPLTARWLTANWWLEMYAIVAETGNYTFEAFYKHSDGSLERLQVLREDSTVGWSGVFQLQADALDPHNYQIIDINTHLEAGQPGLAAHLRACDSQGNTAYYIPPALFNQFTRYTAANQTMAFLSAGAPAASFNMTILPGPPYPPSCRVSGPPSPLMAGVSSLVTVLLVDQWDNPANLQDMSQLQCVVFMKGTRTQPQFGFSHKMLTMLNTCKAEYEVVNVLDEVHNPGLREAIKEYSQWPTIPQLYINGEFVGGCDIAEEMFNSGELQKMVPRKENA